MLSQMNSQIIELKMFKKYVWSLLSIPWEKISFSRAVYELFKIYCLGQSFDDVCNFVPLLFDGFQVKKII